MKNNFYSQNGLKTLGLKDFGDNVLISKKASIYGAENISVGNNVRIDDFCVLSGKIEIGNYVHISAGAHLFAGDAGIIMRDFSGLSPGVKVFAISDDFSGNVMVNSMVNIEYRNLKKGRVILNKHCQIGTNTVILPGVVLSEGAIVGAQSLVKGCIAQWTVNVGIPAKSIKNRSRKVLELEKQFLKEHKHGG